MNRVVGWTIAGAASIAAVAGLTFCGSAEKPPPPAPPPAPAAPAPPPAPTAEPEGPLATVLMSQAQFVTEGGKPKPGPAKLVLWRTDGKQWWSSTITDPESNVFHKAIPWRDGILTIAAGQVGSTPPKPARLTHWKKNAGKWEGTTLYEASWGGKFQRFRDLELGDLTGDGKEDIAIATHDSGVVAVGTEGDDGKWTFVQMDEQADTFVHEVEIGDVDRDGKNEFYVTPSARNKASGESQPGAVARYDFQGGKFVRSWVVKWEESHAKEILVADLDKDGGHELYVVREGHTVKGADNKLEVKDPVKILRYEPEGKGRWKESVVGEVPDKQTRFLVPGDVDHDGKLDLVAASESKGLFLLKRNDDGTFATSLIDADSGGFEHSTTVADLDGDGKAEIYVASDKQKQFRRYLWNGTSFAKEVIAPIPPQHITWNLQEAKL